MPKLDPASETRMALVYGARAIYNEYVAASGVGVSSDWQRPHHLPSLTT